MARLTRKNIKVFAGSATNNGVFGSLQANNPVQTNDVEQLQSLSAWEQGWNDATMTGEELPPLEEFQAIQYVVTYEQAYLMQEGLPEWEATVEYYKGSLAKKVTATGFQIYSSLTDNNLNHQLSDTANWKLVMDSDDLYAMQSDVTQLQTDVAAISYIGDVKTSVRTANHGNWFLCDGQAISRTTYATLFSIIGTTYGDGDGSTTFNLPDYTTNKIPMSDGVDICGNGKTLGLTNGTNNVALGVYSNNESLLHNMFVTTDYGENVGSTSATGSYSGPLGRWGVTTDATKSGITGLFKSSVTMNYFIRVL